MAIITESFTKANSDILGPDLSWTELAGDIDVVNNQAQTGSVGVVGVARADSDLDSVDQYVQAVVNASEGINQAQGEVFVRKDSSATLTLYTGKARFDNNTGGQTIEILRHVAGVQTLLVSVPFVLPAGTPVTLRLEVEGADLRAFVNSGLVASVTDSNPIITGLRTGIRGFKATSGFVSWDNFEAGDLIEEVGEVMITGISSVGSVNGRLKASQLNAVSLPTGIPGVFADGSGNLCVTATPVGAGFPTGYPGVRANADGRLRIATTPVGTLKPSGIPNVDADSNGSIHVEITTTDPSDLPTGIPGVQASADRRLRVILEN